MSGFSFSEFKEFFEYYLEKYARNSDGVKINTLNDLSRKLGYNSPSLLSMIANGRRLPSNDILEALFDEWKIDSSEREIVRLRLEIERKTKKNKPTLHLMEKLGRLDKKGQFHSLDLDTFRAVKEWYIVILQQMVGSPQFVENYTLISHRLRKKVSPAEVRKGFETLIRTGLLKRDQKTAELKINVEGTAETTHDIPSEAIREHHRGMIQRSLEALDEQTVNERHFNSLTLRFSPLKKDPAKDAILNFVREFNHQFYDSDASHIYQLNVQFFEHTYLNQTASLKDTIQ